MVKKWLWMLLCCLLCIPAQAETVQDQALMFIQDAGISADSVNRVGNEVVVTLDGGGTASLWLYGDFDPYDLSWRFAGAVDQDVAMYLDHALSLLAALEKKIPADRTNLPEAEQRRVSNYEVMVSNALLDLERTGQQGLHILLAQLSRHDESGLNSLRARLASRLLGRLDATPVDPAEGLAWYDALTIAQQDDLPVPDASLYVDDPFLAEVTQLLIAHEEAERVDYSHGDDVDGDKAATFVYLSAVTARVEENTATVFCHMISEKLALYDGTRLETLSGSWVPRRIDLIREDDKWAIAQIHETGDGTEYWPSIVAFCEGIEALAQSLTSANTPELHAEYEAAVKAWLQTIGYDGIQDDTF